MADRSRASIRFHLALPFQQSSETTPHMLTRLCYRPRRTRLQFPFCPTPASETAISRQNQHAPRSNSVNNLLLRLQIPHFNTCKLLTSTSADSSLEFLRIPQQSHRAPQTCI